MWWIFLIFSLVYVSGKLKYDYFYHQKNFNNNIIFIYFFQGQEVNQDLKYSACFHFTWLGLTYDNQSIAKLNCSLHSSEPCVKPFIFTGK